MAREHRYRPFKWTRVTQSAAQAVADGRESDVEIIARFNVAERTFYNWRKHPDFVARVAGLVERTRLALQERGIAVKENRVDALVARQKLLLQVIAARAIEHSAAPGGATGLLVMQVKGIGRGLDFERVEEYAVDTGLLHEMREIEKQAAIELGEWEERVTNTIEGTLPDADLARAIAALAAAGGAGAGA